MYSSLKVSAAPELSAVKASAREPDNPATARAASVNIPEIRLPITVFMFNRPLSC